MQIRRVVSGRDAGGKSRVVSDEMVQAATVDGLSHLASLWGADGLPKFPLSGGRPACPTYFPPLGGYRFIILTLPPDAEANKVRGQWSVQEATAARTSIEQQVGSGLFAPMEAEHPGMHTTDTVDFIIVLSGDIWLEVDDGVVVHLKMGDTVVQNGTRHRWSNRGSEPATVGVVMIGGYARQTSAP